MTVAGITFDAIATDQHESYRDFLEEYVAEGYSWAPAQLAAAGPEVDLLYNLGLINYGPEDGVRNIWAYLVDDDVTLDFHVKEGDKITIEGYYLSIGEHKAVDEPVYAMASNVMPATVTDSVSSANAGVTNPAHRVSARMIAKKRFFILMFSYPYFSQQCSP